MIIYNIYSSIFLIVQDTNKITVWYNMQFDKYNLYRRKSILLLIEG